MIDILIVEDNKELQSLMSDFLRAEGYVVSTADSGEKAVSLFERYGAKLVLLDVMLPGMDGFAVCERIRKISDAPIFILSAKGGKTDKLSGLTLGADDYMEKPFDIDILLSFITKLKITDRWSKLDPESGRELFRRLVGEVRGTFKGVQFNEQ